VFLFRPEGPPHCRLSSKIPGSSGRWTTLVSRTALSVGLPRSHPRVSITSPTASFSQEVFVNSGSDANQMDSELACKLGVGGPPLLQTLGG